MSADSNAPTTPSPRTTRRPEPRGRRRGGGRFLLAALVLVLASAGGLWAAGVRPQNLWAEPVPTYEVAVVDRGPVNSYVVESGSLESADKAIVRCQVEALIGTVGGPNAGGGTMGGAAGGGRSGRLGGRTTAGSTGGAGGASAGGGAGGAATKKAATKTTAAATSGGGGGQTILPKPQVQSFSYTVAKHVPLRPALSTNAANASRFNQVSQQQNGGGGFGGEERAGSTRILRILEEGTRVKAGDTVCWLDAADFENELLAQNIKVAQADSWVRQAETAYKVAQISLKEYTEGVYLQDLSLIEEYHATCEIQAKQFEQDYDWELEMFERDLRSNSQVEASRMKVERARISLKDAEGMKEQLVKFTGPKIVAELEAKIAAVEADLQAQKAAYVLEEQRQKRLKKAIDNCVLKAPRDGIVVYFVQSNGWGRVEDQIREGVTVRENQPIFLVPDPSRMLVRVKVNETKVSLLEEGAPALIKLDAFPGETFKGRVRDKTVIPTNALGPFSDVKVYYATVELDNHGFDGLRTGMTAQVEFLVDSTKDALRVPLDAIRWFDGNPFVAMLGADGRPSWKAVKLGLSNSGFAEVREGLEEGVRVVMAPASLPPPSREQREQAKSETWEIAAIPGSPAS